MAYQPTEPKKTQALDYSSGNLIYQGKAVPGSSKASAVWRIAFFTYDVDDNLTDLQFADGNLNYDNIWNDRTSLSYS